GPGRHLACPSLGAPRTGAWVARDRHHVAGRRHRAARRRAARGRAPRQRSVAGRRTRDWAAARERRVRGSRGARARTDRASRSCRAGGAVIECPVARAARMRPEAPALLWKGRTWSYGELDALVGRWHAALAATGFRRAVVRSENRPEMVALLHGAARARIELALLHARLAEAELPPLFDRLGPAIHLGDLPGASPLDAFAAHAAPAAAVALDPGHVQTILFTSGTTGRPKAA